MSLFTEYEKVRAVRKSLHIGSKWEIVESTEGYYGCNTLGGIVTLVELNSTDVGYSYSDYIGDSLIHRRDIKTFLRTCKQVL